MAEATVKVKDRVPEISSERMVEIEREALLTGTPTYILVAREKNEEFKQPAEIEPDPMASLNQRASGPERSLEIRGGNLAESNNPGSPEAEEEDESTEKTPEERTRELITPGAEPRPGEENPADRSPEARLNRRGGR